MAQFSDRVKDEAMKTGLIITMIRHGYDVKDIADALDTNTIEVGQLLSRAAVTIEEYFDDLKNE